MGSFCKGSGIIYFTDFRFNGHMIKINEVQDHSGMEPAAATDDCLNN